MNRKILFIFLPAILLIFIVIWFSVSLHAEPTQNPIKLKKIGFDTCYYFLSGYGLAPIGATILSIKPIDCKCKPDSIDVVLNEELKTKYPDDYFMLDKRKVYGPFKKLNDAENEIFKIQNVIK